MAQLHPVDPWAMLRTMEEIKPILPKKEASSGFLLVGVVSLFFGVLFAARIAWEETFLTIARGPQMIGFTIAHIFPIAFLAPIPLFFWFVVAVVVMIVSLIRGRRLPLRFWSTFTVAALVVGVLLLPAEFWQWAFIGSFAKSARAADIMTTDAAEGYTRTVRGYLDHGISVNARDYEGATAAHAAAVGGKVEVLQLLVSRGADLNMVSDYGDSPLSAAIEMKQASATAYLKAHGAKEIRPVKVIPPADTTVTVDGGK
jgi:hypothetical protein